MQEKSRIVYKGKTKNTVLTGSGKELTIPEGWSLLEPGDAAMTKIVKKAGPTWQIEIKKGRRTFSGGVLAPEEIINAAKKDLDKKRSTPEYIKKLEYSRKRRARLQKEYVDNFYQKTLDFLSFHPKYKELEKRLAKAVTEHATPVGSKTVARTERIPVEERVRAAVTAWMRHSTTAYDHMKIKRIKGERRRVRKTLSVISNTLLENYRKGEPADINCPLEKALR